ncbi:hypothetical protein ACWGCI_00725 [Streptomyces sp. NPDC054949]
MASSFSRAHPNKTSNEAPTEAPHEAPHEANIPPRMSEERIVKGVFRLAGTAAAAVALVFTSALTAQADAQASGTVKAPYASGGKVVGSANLNGPNAPTKFCVTLLAAHPYTPDVAISTTCKTISAGKVTTKAAIPPCGKYATLASAKVNGRITFYKKSGYTLFCS